MIFGLVAMSYRGSYFKIHNLESPSRFMFTQVFPSPKCCKRRKSSVSINSSMEHSIPLEDSGTSISDHSFSAQSTASDTLLVCRHSIPLDVHKKLSVSTSSMICDSGVYGERTCSSFDRNGHCNMIPFWESNPVLGSTISFSNSTIYKRWLRSSSLEQSVNSSAGSVDETLSRHHQRSSRLGLAFILHLTPDQEETQMQFILEHISLLDSMLGRARQATEIAYLRPNKFLSILVKMVNLTSTWLSNLLSGPLLPLNLWTSLYENISASANSKVVNCDNNISIKIYGAKCKTGTSDSFRSFFGNASSGLFNNDTTEFCDQLSHQNEKTEFSFSNITKMIKNEWDFFSSKVFGNSDDNNLAEKFVHEFCGLLDTVDVKDTNFFMSTLLTAVLTHHLGWVATCLPPDNESSLTPLGIDFPFNPFWEQLSDLYGAVGHPTKVAQTIILGTKKKDLVSKIISCLTYFIRCVDVERHNLIRCNIEEDNKTADQICQENSCIPKENYKKYKDHLMEMLNSSTSDVCEPKTFKKVTSKGLSKTKKSYFDLKMLKTDEISEENIKPDGFWTDFKELNNLIEKEKDSNLHMEQLPTNDKEPVVFVLGDDDKLVNIRKKDDNLRKHEDNTTKNSLTSKEICVPNFLDSIFKKYESFEQEFSKSHFKDEDFVKYETETSIKPSTSWSSLQQAEEDESVRKEAKSIIENDAACSRSKPFIRSQSVPPESQEKVIKEEIKSKYRYSGVKFSLHQYPQVVTNYMRSKNLEMSNLSFSEMTKKFDQISLEDEEINSKFDVNLDEMEGLQTPSNASELEFSSELNLPRHEHARESSDRPIFFSGSLSEVQPKSTSLNSCSGNIKSAMKIIDFPMPKSETATVKSECIPYQISLMRGLNDGYIPDLVLQGISAPREEWESSLKNQLTLTSQHCLLDQQLSEAVAVIANTDTWEVQLVSSHTYVIDRSSCGVKVGMSQLIANMLDSLLKMWKLQVPPHLCLMHIEQRLQALCVRSKALAQLLLATEFCSMEFLTSTLHLEVNDVPLLLAVASTYSPQVTQKYGISFQ